MRDKEPNFAERRKALGCYLRQYIHDFHVKDGCLWMEERLDIPIPLRRSIIKRNQSFHHRKAGTFDATRDAWFPYFHRSLASAAGERPKCASGR